MNTHSDPRIAGEKDATSLIKADSKTELSTTLSSRPITELERHKLTLTPDEIQIGKLTAVGSGLGNAAIISSGWLFAMTPWEQVGLGVTVGATASIAILAIVSVTTILLTIPLSYYAYEDYMLETKGLESDIQKQEVLTKQIRENLFFESLLW